MAAEAGWRGQVWTPSPPPLPPSYVHEDFMLCTAISSLLHCVLTPYTCTCNMILEAPLVANHQPATPFDLFQYLRVRHCCSINSISAVLLFAYSPGLVLWGCSQFVCVFLCSFPHMACAIALLCVKLCQKTGTRLS